MTAEGTAATVPAEVAVAEDASNPFLQLLGVTSGNNAGIMIRVIRIQYVDQL